MSEPKIVPFPGGIPLLGQPCTVHSWEPTVLLQCNCEAKAPLMMIGRSAVATCPHCQRSFAIAALRHDGRTGEGSVEIAQVVLPAAGRPS